MKFTEDQLLRYSLYIILPKVGGKGQQMKCLSFHRTFLSICFGT